MTYNRGFMVGEQFLHYRIVRQLGAGGMGVVYEAEDTRSHGQRFEGAFRYSGQLLQA